jgi:hypothetical protein
MKCERTERLRGDVADKRDSANPPSYIFSTIERVAGDVE